MRSVQKIRAASSLFFILSLSACALFPEATPVAIPPALTTPTEPEPPLSLAIEDEINDGELLHVLATVTAHTDWPIDHALIRVTGLQAGEKSSETEFYLNSDSDSASARAHQILRGGEAQKLSLSLPSKGISDYQIELLWGAEAQPQKSLTVERKSMLSVRNLEVQSKRSEECDAASPVEECSVQYTLIGELFNSGAVPIERATLGVGYVWVSEGEKVDVTKMVSQDEEHIDIGKLHMQPGQSKPLKLTLDRKVPEKEGGAFRPTLRILSFNGKPAA